MTDVSRVSVPSALTPPDLPRLKNALRDHYDVEREIGAGGMATVYAARDLRHERRVAIKVMRPDLATSVGAERFLREITIAARLQHPHILGLLDSGSADGMLYYVMPFVDGASLRVRLAHEGELPLDSAVRLLQQVLDALSAAHRQGIVHRDIKPENVMLAGWSPRAGSRWHALVADFGVARALSDITAGAALTGTGLAMGTPAYMSPEQASADPHVDHRADIYAVGALAYEMLAGVPPFTGSSAAQIIAAHMTRRPDPLSRHRDNVPAELEQLVMRALEKRPADRWQTVDEMLGRLETVMTPSHSAMYTPSRTRAAITERAFKISETVCRTLDRASLDPRVIGANLTFLDNGCESDTLVFLIPGLGWDADVFRDLMTSWSYRTIAATPLGFESVARRRIPLGLTAHLGILRELLRAAVAELKPKVVLIGGYSGGADMVMRMFSDLADPPRVDAALALGPNVSIDTCFVTRVFAHVRPENEQDLMADLHTISAACATMGEWLAVHEYLVRFLRSFGKDLAAARRHSQDISAPFEVPDETAFASWFRAMSERVPVVRCVFDESPACVNHLQELRMRNLDERVLGDAYSEDAIVVEPETGHFDLKKPEIVQKHVDAMLQAVRAAR